MGVNVVRIGFFYQLVQSDANPGQLIRSGGAMLDNPVQGTYQAAVMAAVGTPQQ